MVESIVDFGRWEWQLLVEDGDLIARKPIKYDGIRTYSTEDRYVPARRHSTYGLTPLEVIERFQQASGTTKTTAALIERVLAAFVADARAPSTAPAAEEADA